MPSEKSRDRLPFEPRQKKKKPLKQPPLPSKPSENSAKKPNSSAIPDVVSKRMARRMAIFSGIPTALGMSSFFIFYWIVSHKWLEIPTYAVLFVSLGLFGLGVLGLSYGIFSTSWDEQRVGGWWGVQELQVNFGRTIDAWKSARKAAQEAKQAKGN
ncbi:conserved hypothetical protein [Gloeothece citriformis PCC 7424]|uniref:DUF3464 family protein n=1 Tax=Gloeothece citriformis (strain PCC 7424) TaxID=65393 RepID=B7KAZ4_GLOC7|nr:PAM68 family protein [Gloeothece citriformis]ACK70104.1 conserved hypothetical protein [Gloeothece citriformis PCC 7424]